MNLARTITKASRSNFAPSFLFLPKDQRSAIETVYAFSRLIDDAVDQSRSPSEAKEHIGEFRASLSNAASGRPTHPVIEALLRVAGRYDIPHPLFEELISGVEMDLTVTRYSTFEELYGYCYKVASVIGLICIRIFRCRTPESRDHAVAQGIAFQLTNILRDVRSDFDRGRIYLPGEDMARFGYTEKMLASSSSNDAFRHLMAFEADRADVYYRKARELIRPEDRRALVASEIMAETYHRILESIRRADYDVFNHRFSLSSAEKLWIATKGWVANRTASLSAVPS